jgi:hypothetical protein
MSHNKVHHPATPAITPLHPVQGQLPGQGQHPSGTGRTAAGPGRFGDALILMGRAGQRAASGAMRGLRPLAQGGSKALSNQASDSSVDDDRPPRSASFSMPANADGGEAGDDEAGAEEARSQQRRSKGAASPDRRAGVALAETAEWARIALAQGGHQALRDAVALQYLQVGAAGQAPVRTQVLPITAAALQAAGGQLAFGGWHGVRNHLLKGDARLQPPRSGLTAQQQDMNLIRPLLMHQLGLRRTQSQLGGLLGCNAALCVVGLPAGGRTGPLSQEADGVV